MAGGVKHLNLRAQNLTVTRGAENVVEGVSATLNTGEITAICGPNGAGKSSFLLALAGLLDAVEGSVALDDQIITRLHPRIRAQKIGYLPQDGAAAWDVSAESLVGLGRFAYRDGPYANGANHQAVEAAISALDLDGLRSRPVSQLSGGERARVLLARVLAGEPEWILADEPLAALDLAHQLRLLAYLRGVSGTGAGKGMGVAIVLHDLTLAMNHADRVLILDQGRLIADGPPQEALSADIIERVWGVKARWIGESGGKALLAQSPQ